MSSRRRPLFASRKRRTWKRSALIVALIVNGALAMTWFALDWIVPERSARTARDHGPVHVHGLGMNPKDQGLFLTTHTGLWRVAADDGKATRVAERREDIMGFTVEGSDRFLGSGHPDLRDNLPPLLGLIRSRDSGRNWTRVSLLGQADFHVIRRSGKRIYGFDSYRERFLVSRDSGRTWAKGRSLGGLIDFVVSSKDSRRLLASSAVGMSGSADEGASWQNISEKRGFLAWPLPDRLYLLNGRGAVLVSPDGGRRWRQLGEIGGRPAAFLATTRDALYAALHNGVIKQSRDAGASWAVRYDPRLGTLPP